MTKQVIIFGTGDAAEVAHYYFKLDSKYHITGFTVDSSHLSESSTFCNLPITPFETLKNIYPPSEYSLFIALGYSNLNKSRKEKFLQAKDLGYDLVSYVSSRANIFNDEMIGENCFILEGNTIQPFVSIGNNVTLWSGNHIGHHSIIKDHCFIASHAVISGRVTIEESCFIGVNATIRDKITVGDNSIIGAGALVLSNTPKDSVYMGTATEKSRAPSHRIKNI